MKKKEWLQMKQAKEKSEIEKLAKEKLGKNPNEEEIVEEPGKEKIIKGLDQVRAEMKA